MTNIWKNRRRSERVPSDLPVWWIRKGDRVEIRAADISAEGLFLRTEEQAAPGSLMQLEVELPGSLPVMMFAFSRFVGRTAAGAGIGAEIYVMSEQDKRRWRSFYRGQLEETHKKATAATAVVTQ